MATDLAEVQKKLWEAADELRANSGLKASEYSQPVLGLIFLRFAEERFAAAEVELGSGDVHRPIGPDDYKARGVLFLPAEARYEYLLNQPESADLGRVINSAMSAIEEQNPDLKGVLPKVYGTLPGTVLIELLRTLNSLANEIEGDGFGLVYEYFLGQFAMAEGQGGGEFYTPPSIVKLIVEILEPFHGRIYDPACGSGGMFVQSANFVAKHQKNPGRGLAIYGQEPSRRTVPLAQMNLAVHGGTRARSNPHRWSDDGRSSGPAHASTRGHRVDAQRPSCRTRFVTPVIDADESAAALAADERSSGTEPKNAS